MVRLQEFKKEEIQPLLDRYGMQLNRIPEDNKIPYSYWGESEAGRKNNQLFIRDDTPIHSLLHETCHFVCMPPKQRNSDEADAAGSTKEENATCYLQILLADHIARYSRKQQMLDMDSWGYSFRLGSASAWFHNDADDAKNWLLTHEIINPDDKITWKLRQ